MSFKKAFISFRLGTILWMPDERFDETMKLFEKYRGVTDEVAFFTSETHPCLPLSVIQDRCKLLEQRMDAVRKMGYRAGINILSTIGHHNENLPNSLKGDYTPLTDLDGNICEGSRCPNDEHMQRYIEAVYQAMTKARPDFIWIDDDVRLYGHMPITTGCFCDHCLAIFEKETGRKVTRESLKKEFRDFELRKAWLDHNRRTIARLFTLIEKTVHAMDPNLILGFMTGDRYFEGYDFDRWAEILSGSKQLPVMWRPGGGFYFDNEPRGLVNKSHDVGRQIAFLPECVQSIQSEIENFPYQRLKKAESITALEAASHIASGCTGAAFNVLSMYDEPLDEYEPLVARLHRSRPFYDLLVRTLGRSKPLGIHTGWNKNSFAAANLNKETWINDNMWTLGGSHAYEMFELGLPPAYALDASSVVAFTGDQPAAFSDEDLKKILAGGVYLDGGALECLNRMGYREYTGFSVEKTYDKDCVEQLLPHPLNEPFAGRKRDNRQSFLWWNVPAAALAYDSKKASPLSRLVDYTGKEVTPCASGIFENSLGGRVCVAGYFPWTFLQNLSKASQMKHLLRWLSRDTLPAYIASYHKINLWVRSMEKGRLAVVLINSSFDTAESAEIMLHTSQDTLDVYDDRCTKQSIQSSMADGPYRKFILPAVPSWQIRLLVG